MHNDAKTCKRLYSGMQEASKLEARQGYYTISMHGKHHSTMGPQNRAKEAQIMNKISLEHGQKVLESMAKTTCNGC